MKNLRNSSAPARLERSASYAGEAVYFPTSVIKSSVYDDMLRAYRNGMDYRQIALKSGYTPNYVQSVVHKKSGKAEKQI